MRKRVFIYAAPFGYGPSGKALTMAKYLSSENEVTVGVFQDEIVERYNSEAEGFKVLKLNTRVPSETIKALGLNAYDYWISVMEPRLVIYLSSIGQHSRTIFIDSLAPWREKPIDYISPIRLYLAQYFPGIFNAINENVAEQVVITKPIINNHGQCKKNDRQKVVLSFGGIQSPYCSYETFSKYIVDTIDSVANECNKLALDVVVFGHQKLIDERFDYNNIHIIGCERQDVFLDYLAEAKICISTPGVETFYEATSRSTPIFFLPPTNSTQLFQLVTFMEYQLNCLISENTLLELKNACASIDWKLHPKIIARIYDAKQKLIASEIRRSIKSIICDENTFVKQLQLQKNFIQPELPCGLECIQELLCER